MLLWEPIGWSLRRRPSTSAASQAYGAAVTGRTILQQREMYSQIHALRGPGRGRFLFARFACRGWLPSKQAAIAAPMAWARACFEQRVDTSEMHQAWRRVAIRCSENPGINVVAQGLAEATLRALARLGWRFPSPYCFLMWDGSLLDLRLEAPRSLEFALKLAYQDAAACDSHLAQKLGASLG